MAGNLRALFTSHLYAFEKDERLDLDAILNNPNQTLYEFDCVVTRVLGGFNSTEHYYRSVSADQFAKNISCPLLSISASDDPIVDYKTVPVGLAENNPNLVFCKTKGGHLGESSSSLSLLSSLSFLAGLSDSGFVYRTFYWIISSKMDRKTNSGISSRDFRS